MSKNFVSNSDAQELMQAVGEKKLTVADTMPAASPALIDKVRLYIGPDIMSSYKKGVMYQCQALEVTPTGSEDPQSEGWYVYNSIDDVYELTTDTTVVAGTTYYTIEWIGISSAEVDLSLYKKIWGGSSEAWEQLTDAEKAEYDYTFFDDDSSDVFAVVDAVTKGDMHPVTSNAVAEDIAHIENVIAPIDSSATITTLLEQLTTTNSKVTFNSSSRYVIGHVEILNLVFDMSSAANGDIIFTGLGACFDTTYFKPADASGINIFRDTNGNVMIQYAAGSALSIRGQLISILS